MLDIQKFIDKGIYLSSSEFNQKFDELWENMTKSFKKFECLQIYDEPGECPIYDLINKDYNVFSKKLKHNKILDKTFYISTLSKGISMKRLHLIEFPISDYIKFEYYSYYLSNCLGEFIKYNDIKKYNNMLLKDFVIFDNKYLLIHDYDKEGHIKGAWYLTEETTKIQELVTWYDTSFKKAKYFQGIMMPDKNILDLIL